MRYKPWHYQERAQKQIIEHKSAGLFLDMGLGKTVIALTAVQELLYDYFDAARVLIIAPLRVARKTWTDEVKKWDHLKDLKISKVVGSRKERLRALAENSDICVINRENVSWLVNHYESKWPFDMVVVDELSSFKSAKAQRFKSLRKVRSKIKRIVGLTGTPDPNGLMDLWSQLYLLDEGIRLGRTITSYRDQYFNAGRRNGNIVYEWIPKKGAEQQIYDKIGDICISMKSEDYLELPERIDQTYEVELAKEELSRMKQLAKEKIVELQTGEQIIAANAGVVAGQLSQLANGAIYTDDGYTIVHDAKLDALEDIIEAANGEPVLVYYWYKHDLDRLLTRFPTAKKFETDQDQDDWNAGKIPIMLSHPASAGHGLNLQYGGHIIVWFGLTWSLELYLQAIKRLHRQGQTKPVRVVHIVAKDTIDEHTMCGIAKKDLRQDNLMEAVKLSVDDCR